MAPKNKARTVDFDSLGGKERQRPSNFWKPEEPEMIVGRYARKKDGGEYGPIAIIQPLGTTREADAILVGLNPVLEDLLAAEIVGEYVAISFDGWRDTKGGRMREFRVKVLDAATVEELQQEDDLPF